ncbi:hypothetical protein MLD38_030656 [Melastoma candidum]|uniref:Uncharacterized protein n=1 Tax=Melastoma candidum TaxID=119954 RepID=A0ACB9MNI6_9MYRT|nr:hypothetical protein MLD38_030656 [Melastoma candidum]
MRNLVMITPMTRWTLIVLVVSLIVSLRYPTKTGRNRLLMPYDWTPPSGLSSEWDRSMDMLSSVLLETSEEGLQSDSDAEPGEESGEGGHLEYDFYRETCPAAEDIVRKTMTRIYSQHPDAPAALLRLAFHDCFIKGCDASIFLDDNHGNESRSIEKQALPNRTLKGFDKIDLIKSEIEDSCPGIVSCADILVLATREGVLLTGGPFYPLSTGRRDSTASYYSEAMAEIPKPDDDITRTLYLFGARGFTERETVSLLGGHSIGKIGCDFVRNRLYNFHGTGRPDPTLPSDFLEEIRQRCEVNGNHSLGNDGSPPMVMTSATGKTYFPKLADSISSGASFDGHYYKSLIKGRGLLYADQQLMGDDTTAGFVRAYASEDDGSSFRLDFARAMMKMSSLNVLTGLDGRIRRNCSSI